MYFYQLLLAKEWQQQEDERQLARQTGNRFYTPNPKRIKHFYDKGYNDIVKRLVANPESCKNFYLVLQKLGLPEQSYYRRIPDKVSQILKTALFTEKAILIELPPQSGGYIESSNHQRVNSPLTLIEKEPYYESDDSWLIVDLVNHKPDLIDIRNAGESQQIITQTLTSPNEIFLKHGNPFSASEVLPKVHILLGGNQGETNLILRGEKPLRVKKLAQQWLDELSALLSSGNSPFTVEQDEALASVINNGFSPEHFPSIIKLDDNSAFRPDERIGVLFYRVLLVLNQTDFITATERIGDLSYGDSEGAIVDPKLMKKALKSLHNLRHSEGYDKEDYAYDSKKLMYIAQEYWSKPLVLDGAGGDNDYETILKQQISHDTMADELTNIDNLYFNAIKLLKHLRESGMIRHVETRREYKLKTTKLTYNYLELLPLEGFYLKFHKDFKYALTSESQGYRFIGRFNEQGLADIKIPQKYEHVDDWGIAIEVVDVSFIDEYFSEIEQHNISNAISGIGAGVTNGPLGMLIGGITGYLYGDEIRSTYLKYENQIIGAQKVVGGVLTLATAGLIEYGTLGGGTALALSIGFIGSDQITAGVLQILTDKEVATLGEQAIAWSGLVPEGYEGVTYALVDLTLGGKAAVLGKASFMGRNIVTVKYIPNLGKKSASLIRDIKIYVDKLTKNTKNQRHVINLKKTKGLKIPQGLTQKQFEELGDLLKKRLCYLSDDIFIQGSRAGGTANLASDIDIGVRVGKDRFDELIKLYFGTPNVGSAKEKTMLHAIKTGKIQAGEAKLSKVRKEVENMLDMEVDISIILEGGKFDNPPYISIK
ncbi:nucleotidyltransferase domain-containing protein [Orbaceae bacterium ac157xtp]